MKYAIIIIVALALSTGGLIYRLGKQGQELRQSRNETAIANEMIAHQNAEILTYKNDNAKINTEVSRLNNLLSATQSELKREVERRLEEDPSAENQINLIDEIFRRISDENN